MEITSGYELSPLTAQYVDLMTCHPYKEGLSFEPLLKEIFTPMTAGGQFISWRFIGTMYFKMGLICQLSQNLLPLELKGNCQYKK